MITTDNPLVPSVCYVRLAIGELQAAARFASDIFGLQRVAGPDDEVAFRSDHRFRTVSFSNDTDGGSSTGVEVWSETALDQITKLRRDRDFAVTRATPDACRRRHVRAALLAEDGSGNHIDLVVRPSHSGKRYFPSRDAGITRMHGVGLRSTNPGRDLEFWKALGAQVRDWVG